MSLEPGKGPLVAALGLACVVGAAVLAWFSSPSTVRLSREDQALVTAEFETRLFGLVATRTERVEDIRSACLINFRAVDSRSQTPDRLVFETTSGAVDLGRPQQLFAVDYADINAFVQDEALPSLTLSSIARGRERIRFLVAQAMAVFLMLVGLGLEWMVMRSVVTWDEV